MKRKPTANPSSLFLLELIFAILFFSVASAVCVQVFVKSHTLSTQSASLTKASRLTQDAAELLSASTSLEDGKERIQQAYSDSVEMTEESFTVFYNADFSPCQKSTAAYRLYGTLHLNGQLLESHLDFTSMEDDSSLYQLDISHHLQRRPDHEK